MCPVGVVVSIWWCARGGRGSGSPAGRLLGVVAGLAESLSVVGAGRAALVVVDGVVGVPDRGVAPRGAADPVAQPDEPARATREAAARGRPSPRARRWPGWRRGGAARRPRRARRRRPRSRGPARRGSGRSRRGGRARRWCRTGRVGHHQAELEPAPWRVVSAHSAAGSVPTGRASSRPRRPPGPRRPGCRPSPDPWSAGRRRRGPSRPRGSGRRRPRRPP